MKKLMIQINSQLVMQKKIAKEYTKESIFKFMEFDKIEDNMIIQKKWK